MASIRNQWNNLIKPYQEIQHRPLHTEFLQHHLALIHKKVESIIYRCLPTDSADHCMNLIRATPIAFAAQALPTQYRTALFGSGAIFVLLQEDKDHSRTKLLHSIATAFFLNVFTAISKAASDRDYFSFWLETPINLALSTLYFSLTKEG